MRTNLLDSVHNGEVKQEDWLPLHEELLVSSSTSASIPGQIISGCVIGNPGKLGLRVFPKKQPLISASGKWALDSLPAEGTWHTGAGIDSSLEDSLPKAQTKCTIEYKPKSWQRQAFERS